ncbi:MAG: nitrous oxide-stimulated promoter family protein [Candidatus Eiseniibacteriota bacterium]|nr:MAG: nitrous oxide-stimulated promoter family protein [Candidatus Eisenbacteria bacterium]
MAAMIALYCREQHGGSGALCHECAELLQYAEARLEACPLGDEKPTCAKCEIHCYRPVQRERITSVMSFSGPRMMKRHPVLAIRHLADSFLGGRSASLNKETAAKKTPGASCTGPHRRGSLHNRGKEWPKAGNRTQTDS